MMQGLHVHVTRTTINYSVQKGYLAFLVVGKIVLVDAIVFSIFYIVGVYCCMVYNLGYLGEFSYKLKSREYKDL